MKLQIEIPCEFEIDFDIDNFNECFSRVLRDITNEGYAGNYERETIEMLQKAFKKAEVIER